MKTFKLVVKIVVTCAIKHVICYNHTYSLTESYTSS